MSMIPAPIWPCPKKSPRLGLTVLPMDFLPLDEEDIGEEFRNMYWNYGRKVIEAARFVARTPKPLRRLFLQFFLRSR